MCQYCGDTLKKKPAGEAGLKFGDDEEDEILSQYYQMALPLPSFRLAFHASWISLTVAVGIGT